MTQSDSLNYATQVVDNRWRSRAWIGLAIAIVMWLAIKIPEFTAPQTMIQFMAMMWSPMIATVLIIVWWLAFSRTPASMRLIGLIAFVAGPPAAFVLGHKSMQMGFIVFGLPVAITVFALSVFVGRYLGRRATVVSILAGMAIVWGYLCLIRMDGLNGSVQFSNSWRWTKTQEEIYLASLSTRTKSPATMPTTTTGPVSLSVGDWPAFRGPNRDGKLFGISIDKDWNAHPPKQLWKHLIGPGWSSFCVVGDRAFTQEQRGPMELVSCYDINTGAELWTHEETSRFEEAMAGPGPRATPTFADGRLYAQGAHGILVCLDPLTGSAFWKRDVMADSGAVLPNWGFSSSPLVAHGLVTVITGGKGKSVMAYKANTGDIAWSAGDGWSYASPQLTTIGGAEQLLLVTEKGLTALDPVTGQFIWAHDFALPGGANRAVQATILGEGDFVLGAAFGVGTRRFKVDHANNAWTSRELWTSLVIKPYYNDLVVYQNKLYGFDQSVFSCIDPEGGKRMWRAHGYGNGQVLLLADQGLLLILSETGEVALVEASPDAHHEIGRFQAIEGKTWNHPVIAHGKLLVRNGQEIAAFELK